MKIKLLIYQFKRSDFLFYSIRIGALILPALLFFVPIDWLNEQPTICLFKNILGIECIGCGITRAVVSAVQLNFSGAFNYNKLIIIVFPLLIFIWFRMILDLYKKLRNK